MITTYNNYNIRHLNTFRMNVSCSQWIEFTEAAEIPQVLAQTGTLPRKIVGACSNMLFTGDYRGALIHPAIGGTEYSDAPDGCVLVRAGAGVVMDELAARTAAEGLWGLENLSGIPGEAGAAAVQNVGAYGVEAKDVIALVEAYDTAAERFVTFGAEDCAYGYRTSRFKSAPDKDRFVITAVTFRLWREPHPVLDYGNLRSHLPQTGSLSPSDVRATVLSVRSAKLPDVAVTGSAGSFFKNPVMDAGAFTRLRELAALSGNAEPPFYRAGDGYKVPAAWLIEKSGLKGYAMGGAATWHLQPLVIVNASGNAMPEEICALERHIIDTVYNKFGVRLSPEVEHI